MEVVCEGWIRSALMCMDICRPQNDIEFPALPGSTLFPPYSLSMSLGLVVLTRLTGQEFQDLPVFIS